MRRHLTSVAGYLRRVVNRRHEGGLSDADLLQRFATRRDEAAFEVLVWRHGPMVFGVANRVLRHTDDAEDVLQATFLVLVRQATSIGSGEALSSWLYQVAYRTALRIRSQRDKRALTSTVVTDVPAVEAQATCSPLDPPEALDEELQRLPEKYRAPLILSYLQGLSNQEIAVRIGCPIGTVFTRLARGREMLRKRLVRRGAMPAAGLVLAGEGSATASAGLSEGLVQATLRAARMGAEGSVSVLSPGVIALAESAARIVHRQGQARLLGAVLVVLVAAGSGTALWASREAPPNLLAAQPALARAEAIADPEPDKAAEPAPPRSADRPRVVQVFPADGASDVNPITEIRIRFNQPMKRTGMYLTWLGNDPIGFRPGGDIRYDPATREFILPVQLSPGCKHELMVNQVDDPQPGPANNARQPEGFRSEGGAGAVPFRWSFTTAKPAAKGGKALRVLSVDPQSFTEVGQLTALEVTFDQPMDPASYGLVALDSEGFDRGPELLVRANYHPEQHRFTLLMRLPSHWNGEVQLTGFRTREGNPAKPLTLQYRTGREILSPPLRKHVEEASRSTELRQLTERIRAARRQLRSVSEDAVMTHFFGVTTGDRYQMLQTRASRFQMDGDRNYLAVVDDFLRMPFRLGVMDTTCWLRGGNDLFTQPSKEIRDKNTRICDPFNALNPASTADIIQKLQLEYLGEARVQGRRCYHFRSWDITRGFSGNLSPVRTWHIDAETLLPLRVELAETGLVMIDYTHTRINQPIPEAEFRPESGPDVHFRENEPLSKDCTHRFLTISDGTAGRISVNWGEAGPKVSRSGGVN
jgi:RNA polymerase sigma factor (sigma-70 family)